MYYSFFNEESDNPFLMILVPDNPSYIDENNCLLIFTAKDGEVHLTDFMTSMEEAYTSVYVGKEEIISLKEYPLGMHSGSIISAATYGVSKDALHHSNIDTSKHYISDKEARIDAAAEAASSFFG